MITVHSNLVGHAQRLGAFLSANHSAPTPSARIRTCYWRGTWRGYVLGLYIAEQENGGWTTRRWAKNLHDLGMQTTTPPLNRGQLFQRRLR